MLFKCRLHLPDCFMNMRFNRALGKFQLICNFPALLTFKPVHEIYLLPLQWHCIDRAFDEMMKLFELSDGIRLLGMLSRYGHCIFNHSIPMPHFFLQNVIRSVPHGSEKVCSVGSGDSTVKALRLKLK